MSQELSKSYDPSAIEQKWAWVWVERGLFTADAGSSKPMFSIVIPPPNVTGSLHMGHMLEHTQIDALVRWKRMQGFNTLWLPGTDHAGIATQVMVERQLASEGITRQQLGREAFERRVWKWKEESGDTIKKQMVRLGASCDWSRERFTLDPGLSGAVREVFVRLFEKGLIYRGTYIIQWCPRCQTALSDLEVVHEEKQGSLWHIRYPVVDAPGEYVVVATTRPETMLGDTAVAVNPSDERYTRYHGRKALLPLMNREIPFIVDELARPEFATGVVKVTPAHDPNDFEAGLRHNLPQVEVIDASARMTDAAGPYRGLDRHEARKRIVSDLEHRGLLEKVQPYIVPLGGCQRCGTVVEPRVSTQWFVRVGPLARRAAEVVEDGRIRFTPENYARDYLRWLENIHDWCISRQLWWGHRIPAWYCRGCGKMMVARDTPASCDGCGGGGLEQDPDVLDTWFSSALWPFSTMGWPDETEDLRVFYPTSLLITGFDILFFWVARMVMMGAEFMGDVPFREVYIHALVRTAERQKMSKTRGNVIDPLEVTEKYGTDAVRFTLAIMASPGTDIALSESRMESYRAFANKIWNAARFIFLKGEGVQAAASQPFRPEPEVGGQVTLEDRWMLSRLNRVAGQLNAALEQYRFHEAAHVIYQFFWHEFCDWYIELAKLRNTPAAWRNLVAAFENALRLLHPFMPFLTEELWQRVTGAEEGASIALQPFPQADAALLDDQAEGQMAALQEAIVSIRNARAEMKVEPRRQIAAEFYSPDPVLKALAEQYLPAFERLAQVDLAVLGAPLERQGGLLRHASSQAWAFDLRLPYAGAIDTGAERRRLEKERERLGREYASLESQLGNPGFRARAPEHVVAAAEQKLRENQVQRNKIQEALESLGDGLGA